MTWLRLAFADLLLSPLTTLVNVLLMALGAASIVLLLLASSQFASTMSRDAKGIDLVVGALGSPVQLVLSAVYHADIPPGNVKLADVKRWSEDRRVATAIPLSLGDSFRGYRIVGTTHDYIDLYSAELAEGREWSRTMEAVVGAAVAESGAIGIGSTFAGAHGFVEGGDSHDAELYRVVGVLAPTGTVIDRLVLTSLESVWDLHDEGAHDHEEHADHDEHGDHEEHADHDEHSDHEEHADDDEHGDDEEHADHDEHGDHEEYADHDDHGDHEDHIAEDAEITAMLFRYRSPLAATTLPRDINSAGFLQAAAPAMEVTRILQLVGVGMTALQAFAWVLVATAALSIFAALYGSLRSRRGELAMLRCLGATRSELLVYLVIEGLLLSVMGVVLGFLVGHVLMELVGLWLASTRGVVMTGWIWIAEESLLLIGLFCTGVLGAIIPAIQAYRTDVATTLSEA